MNIISPTVELSDAQTGGFAGLNRALHQWWWQLPAAVRSPVWPRILATLWVLGLLLAFHQVVSGAALQGELRRKAAAMHTEAIGRCNILSGIPARDSCLSQLQPPARDDSVLYNRRIARAAPIE